MRVEKEFRVLEDIDEVRIFNASRDDFYNPTPKEFDINEVPISEFIENISDEIHMFIPHENGKDFIIQRIGNFSLNKYDCSQEDLRGRLLGKVSPLFYNIFNDYLQEVYSNRTTKNIRCMYYAQKRLVMISQIKIVFDMERIFVISHNVETAVNRDARADRIDEDKVIMLESLSQTGSYYNTNGKYNWSQGIYNIINRAKEDADEYYNIVFDLVIPEDKHIVDKIFDIASKETSLSEEIIRIKTVHGDLKVIEVKIHSYFDEEGKVIYQGLINDVTQLHHQELSKPVDFLLDGFKNSKKLALLIEPLNRKQYNFSKGFYYLVEKDYEEYLNSREIINNIAEEDSAKRIRMLANGEITRIDETMTYLVDGNPEKRKTIDLYIERFNYNNAVHSLGFLTDITEEREKQEELAQSNEQQMVLIKELHHRVKNNLQILTSFLNLEKRAYRNNPDLIIGHMLTRLGSLALLHEKTYNSSDFKNINLKEYLLDQDVNTRKLADSPMEIEFETDVDESLNLSIEVITPLLLIVDELTMSAIKRAIPDETTPKRITKKVTKLDSNTALLVFEEKGIAIKDSSDIANAMGCEIVKSLTKQLDGNISAVESENSTEYRLVFPIEMEHTIN